MYSVTYRPTAETDEAHVNSINALNDDPPAKVTLEEVIANCRDLHADADLFDPAGARQGWVHADGRYTLT